MLALGVGILLFFSRNRWKRWFGCVAGVAVIFTIVFTGTHLIATRGQSLGWELLGFRLQTVIQPQIEESSLSRMLILPKIWEKIKEHAILGNGLGDTIIVYSPTLQKKISTPHFDWGYLELWDELGIMGIVMWGLLLGYVIRSFYLNKNANSRYFITALASLIVINITSPAIFHVMGIVLITTYFTFIYKFNIN